MQLLLYINYLLNKNCCSILCREISMKRNTIYTKFHIPRHIPRQGKISGHYQDFWNFQDVGHPVIRKAFFLTIALSPQYLIDNVQCLLGCLLLYMLFNTYRNCILVKFFLQFQILKLNHEKQKDTKSIFYETFI